MGPQLWLELPTPFSRHPWDRQKPQGVKRLNRTLHSSVRLTLAESSIRTGGPGVCVHAGHSPGRTGFQAGKHARPAFTVPSVVQTLELDKC